MMYLLSTLVTGAAAVVTETPAPGKITYNAHSFNDKDLVWTPKATTGNGTDNKVFVVTGKTDNDFALKGFHVDTAGTAGGAADAVLTVGTAPKSDEKNEMIKVETVCQVDLATAAAGVTCKDNATIALTDTLMIYCEDNTKCKLDGTGTDAKILSGKMVTSQVALDGTTKGPFKLKSDGTAFDLAGDLDAGSKNKIWLLKESSPKTWIYPNAPAVVGGANTFNADKVGQCNTKNMGTTCLASADSPLGTMWFYYGHGETATVGLTAGTVYNTVGDAAKPFTFKLAKATVGTGVLAAGTTAVDVTTAGKGSEYRKVEFHRQITASAATGDKLTLKGDNSAGNERYTENKVVTFYCADTTTAADCDYKLTGGTNGAQFKVKSATNNLAVDSAIVLKAATGTSTDAIAVTADTTATKGFLLLFADQTAGKNKMNFPPGATTAAPTVTTKAPTSSSATKMTVWAGVVAVAVAALA